VSLGPIDISGRDALTWLGGSDAAAEGTWRWVNGPEIGTVFWVGTAAGSAPPGAFAWWDNPSTPGGTTGIDPNDFGGNEDFLELRYTGGRWNDSATGTPQNLPGFNPDGVTRTRAPVAYLVEYGGTIPPPLTFTVTNLNDSGVGSLREAIVQSNQAPGPNTIDFAPGLTGTIVLTSGQLPINGPLTIVGPGAGVLTIDGNANSRVFAIFENVADVCATPGTDFPVSISGLTLTNGVRNVANTPGGAIYSEKTLTLSGVAISNSHAFQGGGVGYNVRYSGQTLTINNSQFLNNVARPLPSTTSDSTGGGLRVAERCTGTTSPVTITISNSLFSGNQTRPGATYLNAAGGGMHINAAGIDLTMTDSRFVGNSVVNQNPEVPGANNRGGGVSIPSANTVRIERSEIAGNSANRGGGVRLVNDALARQTASGVLAVTIVNSTISGNVAATPIIGGGGMSASGNVALVVDNSTVTANSSAADAVGGILLDVGATTPPSAGNALPPTLTLQSSIVADNLNGAPDIGISDEVTLPTVTVNASQSLIGSVEPTVSVVGSGNLLGVSPNLGPLAFNGGPTRTHALLAGSPAINAGSNPLALATDQRGVGFPRVFGAAADMGAFELAPPTLANVVLRRVHGPAGTFNLPLSAVAASPTVEPRFGPAHTLVFTFDKAVTSGTATVTLGTATAGTPTFNGSEMIVPLADVANQQYVTVVVSNVAAADGGTGGSGSIRIGYLAGDVNQNRGVSLSDLGQVNAQIAQPVTATNYLKDVNASGTLSLADKGLTNTQLTKVLPAP
jgi:predicted outer membrane repeat protein